jgi:MFS family permease
LLIISARGIRSSGLGVFSVLAAIYLHVLGFDTVRIGLFLSVGIAGGATYTTVTIFTGDAYGRRRLLVIFSLLMGLAAFVIAWTDSYGVLLAAVFVGGLTATGANAGGGAVVPLEQAALAGAVPGHRRTELYAVYGAVGIAAAAVGTLAAGVPELLQRVFSLDQLAAIRVMLFIFAALVLLATLLYALLSPAVDAERSGSRWVNPLRLPSRRIIFTLSGLFSIDAFAGNLAAESLVSLWFFTKFGIPLSEIGLIFFGYYVLAAISLWVSTRLARRIGLINTMVFTHIPSSLFLIAVPFLPAAWLAAAFWLARGFLGRMDVPARESYTMAVVGASERSAMAGMNNVSRSAVGSVGPSAATALWSLGAASIPFVACGVIKIGYDLTLFALFRRVKPPEEQAKPAPALR